MTAWDLERAERHLLSLELFGMRFGLERMRRLLTALDSPHRRFRAIHVVGTNGKSSTTRMAAAILRAHGLRAGAFLSPHLISFAERIRVDDADLDPDAFARAVQRAGAAAAMVDRTLAPGERVTQFELLTAAAFAELARQEVDVAVVEAGLGGRFDATNVLAAPVVVLTNVGLEHTRWLGPTLRHIAREKLAVVPPGATLVVGELAPDAAEEARAVAARQGVRLVPAPAQPEVAPAARGGFQRRNFAVARTAAAALLGDLDAAAVRRAAASVVVPGRFQVVDDDPPTVYDGAHNSEGIAALADALTEWAAGRRLVAVLSVLEDKDAAGMLARLLPLCAAAVFTSNANPRALPPATLSSLAEQVAGPPPAGGAPRPFEVEPDPRAAVARARALAGPDGAVVATGSIYLLSDLLAAPGRRRASAL